MNLLEGYYGGSSDLRDQQFRELQNALVLASGSLDMMATAFATIAGFETEKRGDISWPNLMDARSTLSRAVKQHATLKRCATELRNLKSRGLLSLTYELRSIYQHRHALKGGVAIVPSDDGRTELFRKNVVPLYRNPLPESWARRHKQTAHQIPGILDIEGSLYLLPHSFVRNLTRSIAKTAEKALSGLPWPDAEWVQVSHDIPLVERERAAREWP